jgi:hypothetical protein
MIYKICLLLGFILGASTSPVVEKRGIFTDYFNSVKWTTNNGLTALAIDHKWIQMWDINDSFNILKSRFGSDYRWKNEATLYNQYFCHVQFAPLKNPWNLEPDRTGNYFQTIFGACNPSRFSEFLSESE